MRTRFDQFLRALSQPLALRSRVILALATLPLALSFVLPLWTLHMQAPQYPQGLELSIYAHTLEGDLREINNLNHYIGMARIDRAAMADLDWIPFAIGALILLTLRVAAIGNLRGQIDLAVLFAYFALFSAGRFAYRLYWFGHNLDPQAPFRVEAFTPGIPGTQQIANFTTTSLPGGGCWLIALFAVALLGTSAWEIRRALRTTPRPVRAKLDYEAVPDRGLASPEEGLLLP